MTTGEPYSMRDPSILSDSVWHPGIPHEFRNNVVLGDARKLIRKIPDESIDLILCDPVYGNIDDYRWLSREGKRVLKPGGSVVAQYGNYFQLEVLNAMAEHLDFVWPLVESLILPNSHFDRKVISRLKFYAWFSKGARRKERWMVDIIPGGGKSKEWHKWGDHPRVFQFIISRLTSPGDVVLDPFTGAGTVPVACLSLGRNFIAFDIDPTAVETARKRIETAPRPLLLEEQLKLL